MLERARAIAQAELDLARVRRAKVSLIERACAFGELDPPQAFSTVTQIKRFFNALDRGRLIIPKPLLHGETGRFSIDEQLTVVSAQNEANFC